MKNKVIRFIPIGLMPVLLISLLFFTVPASQAQTSQIWSAPINLSNAGSSVNPGMIIDTTGIIHVVWFDQFDGYKYTNSSNGKNWTEPKAVLFPFSPVSFVSTDSDSLPEAPVLINGNDGEIHAFWLEKSDRVGVEALYYSKTSSGSDITSGWTTRARIADAVIDFDVVISPQGVLHVGYVSGLSKNNNNPVGVFYQQLIKTKWSSPNYLYSSQYFRALNAEEANIDLAVTEVNGVETVYMVWDDRPQKQVLFSKSLDGGIQWEDAIQIRHSEDNSGLEMPFKINISVIENKILLLWNYGQTESQCTQYSQWSTDGAKEFSPPEKVLTDSVGCPETSDVIIANKDFTVIALKILDDISLVAWNGSRWSKPEIQGEISSFVNPVTFDSVLLSCKKLSSYNERIFMVGCDRGNGGDIWLSSRKLGAIEELFPPASDWNTPVAVVNAGQKISELSLVSDNENNIHAFWINSPVLGENAIDTIIQHANWNGEGWSNPADIFSGFDGSPLSLAAYSDSQNRLMLSWVDSKTGDILFSWAAANRANIVSEWITPLYVPSVSQANSSPDILVDDTGAIIIAYAIPINENRGIFFVRSDDGGTTWAQPIQIFDAASAGWNVIDQPEISLTGDGTLHILFKRYSTQGEPRQTLGLYYSKSVNGGGTWIDPEVVSNQPVLWSEIVSYGKSTVNKLWQEYRQSKLVSFHQISQDGGVTWDNPIIVSNVDSNAILTSKTFDRAGNLYFIQLTGKENLTLQSRIWNGSSWISQEPKELYIKDRGVPFSAAVSISSEGNLLTAILVDYPYTLDNIGNSLVGINKFLAMPDEMPTPYPAIIPVVEPTLNETENETNMMQSPTQAPAVNELADISSSISKNKNLVGLLMLGGITVLIIFLFRPVIWKKNRKTKN